MSDASTPLAGDTATHAGLHPVVDAPTPVTHRPTTPTREPQAPDLRAAVSGLRPENGHPVVLVDPRPESHQAVQRYRDAGYLAIRGREQQLIDYHGARRARERGLKNFRAIVWRILIPMILIPPNYQYLPQSLASIPIPMRPYPTFMTNSDLILETLSMMRDADALPSLPAHS